MSYCRAEEVLPMDLILMIQKYTDGVNLYIPRKDENRVEWGTTTAYRQEMKERDTSIYHEYLSGVRIDEIAKLYFLSEKSIQRIIRCERKNRQDVR